MRDIKDVEAALLEPLPKAHAKTRDGKVGAKYQYMKVGAIALNMNKAFGQLGWDVTVKELHIVKGPYKVDSFGHELAADSAVKTGFFYNCIAYAVVRISARAKVRNDGGCMEVVREDSSTGAAVGGKARSLSDAFHIAVTAAVTNATRRACRHFGPTTGLTLQFEAGERDTIQRELDSSKHLEEAASGDETVEQILDGAEEEEIVVEVIEPSHEVAAEPTVAEEVAGEEAVATEPVATEPVATEAELEVPAVLATFVAQDLIDRIWASTGQISSKDIGSFHASMSTTFGKRAAHAIWNAAGVSPGRGAVVTRMNISGVAQVLDEAHASEGGISGFIAQYEELATPPAVPTPAEPTPPAVQATPEADQSIDFGEWGDAAKARSLLKKKIGPGKDPLIEALVTVPDNAEMPELVLSILHTYAMKACERAGVSSTHAHAAWAQVGFTLTNVGAMPTGRQARAFLNNLPQTV